MRLLFWNVQLFGFPTSAPACMWLYWCSWYWYKLRYWWYRYCLLWLYGKSIWALRLTPPGVFRLRCRSGPAKKPAGLPSSPPNARGPLPLSDMVPAHHVRLLSCSSAGHSAKAYVTGLKSSIGVCREKARTPCAVPVQADTPLCYVTAFKSAMENATEKAREPVQVLLRAQSQTLRSLRDWPRAVVRSPGTIWTRGASSARHSASLRDGLQVGLS